MSTVRIKTREEVDPAGRKVDLFPEVDLVSNFVFDHATDNYVSDYLPKIIDSLIEIRKSGNRRVRERSFPVWIGRTSNRIGMDMVCICIPDPILLRVHHYFWEAYYSESDYLETGSYRLRDAQGKPICRYDYGKIILYVSPFENPEWLEKIVKRYPSENFELRSWQKLEDEKKDTCYSVPPKPDFEVGRYHTLESWAENRTNILEYLTTLMAPMGYSRLKKIATNHFGIHVTEESLPGFYKYGCLRLSWLHGEEKATVRILINEDLHYKLKYVVLAHEICHYILHFPLLLVGQMVEEGSWTVPELEWYFKQRMTHFFGEGNRKLEVDANQLASYFLIPAWMSPMEKITSVMMEGGRQPTPAEMIWRFLQPLFPDTESKEYSWVNWNEMLATIDKDIRSINRTEESTLYLSMLNATISRESQPIRQEVDGLIEEFSKDFNNYYAIAIDISHGSPDNSDFFQKEFESDNEGEEDFAEDWEELSHSGQSFGKKIIPPLNLAEGQRFFKKIPLQPAIYNLKGDLKNDWKYVVDGMNSPAGTVDEWWRHKPDYGLALYFLESWQISEIEKVNKW